MSIDHIKQRCKGHSCKLSAKGTTATGSLGDHTQIHNCCEVEKRTKKVPEQGSVSEEAADGSTDSLDLQSSRTFPCRTCQKVFNSGRALGGHRKTHRPPELNLSHETVQVAIPRKALVSLSARSPSHNCRDMKKGRIERNMTVWLDSLLVAVQHEKSCSDSDKQVTAMKSMTSAGKYECSTCNKVFLSHQALGGHRASHGRSVKRDSSHILELKQDCGFQEVASGPASSESWEDNLKIKGHACSICHKVFPTGQALGGHKRCHWKAPGSPAHSTVTASLESTPVAIISMDKAPAKGAKEVRVEENSSTPARTLFVPSLISSRQVPSSVLTSLGITENEAPRVETEAGNSVAAANLGQGFRGHSIGGFTSFASKQSAMYPFPYPVSYSMWHHPHQVPHLYAGSAASFHPPLPAMGADPAVPCGAIVPPVRPKPSHKLGGIVVPTPVIPRRDQD